MKLNEAMGALRKAGTAQNRKVYARHGMKGDLFGVSYANLGKVSKAIKTDHALAAELWATGNHDARVLATMVANPAQVTRKLTNNWARGVDNYAITDALAGLVAKSPCAMAVTNQWTRRKDEWMSAAGFVVLARLAMKDASLTDEELAGWIELIEREIHTRPNRTRYSMNGALIAIGIRNTKLKELAIAAAKRIGKVEVDHGETGCKTPEAAGYIEKTWGRKKT